MPSQLHTLLALDEFSKEDRESLQGDIARVLFIRVFERFSRELDLEKTQQLQKLFDDENVQALESFLQTTIPKYKEIIRVELANILGNVQVSSSHRD